MKKRIGIAIYPEKMGIDKTIEYLKMAKTFGVERLYATFLQINMFSNNKE
ncbi:MupG family TIM beta-alpha barrel fold protein [Spiroplasma clarkii]|uniref:6-phospho-N-acetylmuramidase N-terminal domain-containing protein n=1 Tax=Spiroplasma clarkii TaxID=2139 RepID=A0A2K8KLJ4_9MOLU|nr:MupG family TIM beta-alpha barrel fold protein [Spiroplasma clarkii]ATX71231.1 hypothetical protein SCLAR_v1c09250 [Spiroplasma clarkii]